MDFVDKQEADDIIIPTDETFSVYVAKDALQYIQGTVLDYVTEGLNKRLIFKNPNETGSCGCGESFSIE